jgi:hypothetical protein
MIWLSTLALSLREARKEIQIFVFVWRFDVAPFVTVVAVDAISTAADLCPAFYQFVFTPDFIALNLLQQLRISSHAFVYL